MFGLSVLVCFLIVIRLVFFVLSNFVFCCVVGWKVVLLWGNDMKIFDRIGLLYLVIGWVDVFCVVIRKVVERVSRYGLNMNMF